MTGEDVAVKLEAAIHEAQRYGTELPHPPNEANTCDWVIRPLLVASGYLNHEILAQTSDVAKKIPDYTLLSSTDHTWFLEAKAWSVALESDHVDQAMNYAHSNGKRWVVLTNGKEWRLYDDHIQGVSANRLVVTATLQDTANILKFLLALSRESMISKKVVEYASEKRLREYLTASIADPTSAIVQAIVQTARKQLVSVPIQPHVVSEILLRIQVQPVPQSATIDPAKPQEATGEHLFRISYKGRQATAYKGEGKNVIVLEGSELSKSSSPSYKETFEVAIERLVKDGLVSEMAHCYRLKQDVKMSSPSLASSLVFGSSSNGWDSWKDPHGRTMHEVYRVSKAPSTPA